MQTTPHTVGIIGEHLHHSLSPTMQNGYFEKANLPFVYLPFQVDAKHLCNLMQTMRLMDVVGLNVTAPLKSRVLSQLNMIDSFAKICGSVNTLVMRRGRIKGYNTDGAGCLAALDTHWGLHPRGQRILLVGAGGTARAIALSLVRQRASLITIVNRTPRHANQVARMARSAARTTTIAVDALNAPALRRLLPQHDLIIQTTSAPRTGRGALRWPARCAPKAVYLHDCRYGPGPNDFVDVAKASTVRVADGFEMLVQQAARSMKYWLGQEIDIVQLRRCGRAALRASAR
jgi:shikimate dehydrogenase